MGKLKIHCLNPSEVPKIRRDLEDSWFKSEIDVQISDRMVQVNVNVVSFDRYRPLAEEVETIARRYNTWVEEMT